MKEQERAGMSPKIRIRLEFPRGGGRKTLGDFIRTLLGERVLVAEGEGASEADLEAARERFFKSHSPRLKKV